MRLTCPNCAAQYEVDDRLIPPGGRDVQCSACGHAWFFMAEAEEGALSAPPPRDAAARPAAPPPHTTAPSPPRSAPPSAPASAPASPPPPASASAQPRPDEPAAPVPAPAAGAAGAEPRRPALDPAVADVLRAEAEREARARRAEAAAIESQ
ncbi:MAG: zinc-ribbon domain-containing protein, partial [Rhodobacteraceae bacterium]|nr:zinc-ribbon domain-containing protein [Paracoccaceae bacterium]